VATIKVRDGDAAQYWPVLAFIVIISRKPKSATGKQLPEHSCRR